MKLTPNQIDALQNHLDQVLTRANWESVVSKLEPTGIADRVQIMGATGLTRSKATRILEALTSSQQGLPPVFNELPFQLSRPGQRGRSPKIYLLSEIGAALCRALGFDKTRALTMRDQIALQHRLAMTSIHLAAQQTGVEIATDKVIPCGQDQSIRPDHRITLADGRSWLLEVEQEANIKHMSRYLESLQNKQAFFTSPQADGFLPGVWMVFNLAQKERRQQAETLWRTAYQQVEILQGGELAFSLWAMPLTNFVSYPEWEGEFSTYWTDLSQEAQADGSAAADTVGAPPAAERPSCIESATIINALFQAYQDSDEGQPPDPDPHFIVLMKEIHGGSFGPKTGIDTWQGNPHASVYLLKRYLEMCPELRTRLHRTIHRGRGKIRWSPTNILHRMQAVFNVFLDYHGWNAYGEIQVEATMDRNCWEGPGQFGVDVKTYALKYSSYREKQLATNALTWVLWALFEYAQPIGLGRPEFW